MVPARPPQPDSVPDAPLLQRIARCYPELPLPPDAGLPGGPPAAAGPIDVPAGVVLFEESSPCQGFPLVLQGEVRVARGTPGGRSIELYRVGPGDFCVLSAAALFGHAPMPGHGVTATPTQLALLSPAQFEAWTDHLPFRRHVFGLFAQRLADVMALTEAVAFQRLDQRLAAALLGHGSMVAATHQALADELGTVREIVSRLLRRFERAGWIALARERIEVLDAAALRRAAEGP
ncbi:Crp/Fnr family transcriptional regulator [Azohydromonas aeria]|uniref:Crp/Fnr family transcriptional regulator n=1 Tax=Azohydromonas aeria TaxID=2590212 RepID=UPI0012FCECDC|nr:Crp/Fnr family transcriptional regulator [Azohydromonas aeria]